MRLLCNRILLAALLAAWTLSGSCDRGGDGSDSPPTPANRAPVIDSLLALPASIDIGQSAVVTATATDPDGDAVTYAWSATGGTIAGAGASVSWEAAAAPGLYTVTVTVSDGRLTDQAAVDIAVLSPAAWLSGTYTVAGFEHDFIDSHHIAVTGTLTFDGAGGYSGTVTVNADGVIETQSPAGTYGVTGTGEVAIDDGGGGTLSGGLDAARQITVVSRVTPDMNPLALIAVKRSGTYSQASLSGAYHVAAFHWDGGGGTPAYAGLTGVGTFDPVAGTVSITATNNWGGSVASVSVLWDYSVASDGTLTITNPDEPLDALEGGVMTGGDVLAAASVAPGGKPMMVVAIRKSGTFTANSVAGAHRTLSIGPSAAGASVWTGERVFDGLSAWTAEGTLNDTGTISSTSGSGTYSITAEGRMTMTYAPRVYELGVREGGTCAAGAAITSGEAPRFVFSVRK